MPGFQLPESTLWGAICAWIAWAFRIERWKGRVITRDEHREICEDHQLELKAKLDMILRRLDRQDEDSREHREMVSASLHTIDKKVAILQSRTYQPGDTGRFKSL